MRDTASDPKAIAADAGSLPLTHPLVAAVLRARRSTGLPSTASDGSTDANAAVAGELLD